MISHQPEIARLVHYILTNDGSHDNVKRSLCLSRHYSAVTHIHAPLSQHSVWIIEFFYYDSRLGQPQAQVTKT